MLGYTAKAEIIDSNSPKCYAKETEGPTKEYFVRQDRKQNGNLFDPTDMMANTASRLRGTGIEWFPWVEVSKGCFDLYITFLKTGNRTFLLNASRARSDF